MPDEDDRPRDASSAADDSWTDLVVPDDISALTSDIEAYHREQRRARRQARIQRWMDRRGALPLAIVAFAVIIAGLVATLLTVLAPHAVSSGPRPLPLSTTPTAAPGAVGGLLPVDTLKGPDGPVADRSIRPALIALVPVHCNCANLVMEMARQALSVGLPLNVVVPAAADADAAKMSPELKGYTVNVFYDANRTLATTYRVAGVTAVLVGADGVVSDRLPVTLNSLTELGFPLQQLVLPP